MRLVSTAVAALLVFALAIPVVPDRALAGDGLVAPAATDFSAARKKRVKRGAAALPRYRQGPGTIACTRAGCQRVPPGCHGVRERSWDGSPTGFEVIVCR